MKRGTSRILFVMFVISLFLVSFVSAGFFTDVANRFSGGTFSLITGFGIFDFFRFTGFGWIASTDDPEPSSDHGFEDTSCQTNEDCFGKAFLLALPSERCRDFDEYADNYFVNLYEPQEIGFPSCVCSKGNDCVKKMLTSGVQGSSHDLRTCYDEDDCQGIMEVCVEVPGYGNLCKEPDCENNADCIGEYPRINRRTGKLEAPMCDPTSEFPNLACYCDKSRWCMMRSSWLCDSEGGCLGLSESCSNGVCQEVEFTLVTTIAFEAVPVGTICQSSDDCDATQICEDGECAALTGKELQARELYNQIMEKKHILETRITTIEWEEALGAGTAEEVVVGTLDAYNENLILLSEKLVKLKDIQADKLTISIDNVDYDMDKEEGNTLTAAGLRIQITEIDYNDDYVYLDIRYTDMSYVEYILEKDQTILYGTSYQKFETKFEGITRKTDGWHGNFRMPAGSVSPQYGHSIKVGSYLPLIILNLIGVNKGVNSQTAFFQLVTGSAKFSEGAEYRMLTKGFELKRIGPNRYTYRTFEDGDFSDYSNSMVKDSSIFTFDDNDYKVTDILSRQMDGEVAYKFVVSAVPTESSTEYVPGTDTLKSMVAAPDFSISKFF